METPVPVNETLLREALRVTHIERPEDAVALGLKTLIQMQRQEQIRVLHADRDFSPFAEHLGLDMFEVVR